MTTDPSDIVERLRKHSAMGGCYEAEQAMKEAAAEIERLRAALADVKERCAKVAEEIGEKHLQWSKMNLPVEPSPIIAKDRADVAKRIAASIRALDMGGEG